MMREASFCFRQILTTQYKFPHTPLDPGLSYNVAAGDVRVMAGERDTLNSVMTRKAAYDIARD